MSSPIADLRSGRSLPTDRVRAQQEPQGLDRLVDRGDRVERRPRQAGQPVAADRHQDRVHLAVEPGELVVGGRPPRFGGRDLGQGRGTGRHLGQQVDVHADHGERRPQVVGHDRQQLGPGGVERRQLGEPRLDLGGEPALLHDPREQRRDRPQEVDLLLTEDPRRAGLDVEHADHLAMPLERDRQHAGERLDVEAADPGEPVVERHVLDGDRLAAGGDPPGDALAPGEADPAHLRGVEAVGRSQRETRVLVVGEVERAHLDAHRDGRPVHDRVHELVPVAGLGREPGDVVEERQLAQASLGRCCVLGHAASGWSTATRRPVRRTDTGRRSLESRIVMSAMRGMYPTWDRASAVHRQ